MKYLIGITFFLFIQNLNAQSIVPDSAVNHVGEMSTVCGKVESVFMSKTNNIYVSFGRAYPDNSFTAVIFAKDTAKFIEYKPQDYLKNKTVCVMGTIQLYKGKPQIVVKSPNQIRFPDKE